VAAGSEDRTDFVEQQGARLLPLPGQAEGGRCKSKLSSETQ
jgi:hypothetical protein